MHVCLNECVQQNKISQLPSVTAVLVKYEMKIATNKLKRITKTILYAFLYYYYCYYDIIRHFVHSVSNILVPLTTYSESMNDNFNHIIRLLQQWYSGIAISYYVMFLLRFIIYVQYVQYTGGQLLYILVLHEAIIPYRRLGRNIVL